MKVKKQLLTILILYLVVVLVGCQKENIEGVGNINKGEEEQIVYEPVEGGEIDLPLTRFNTLNPLLTDNISYFHFSKLLYEGLFEFDENLNIATQLAESYTLNEDGRTVSIKLMDQIYWHDGKEFTANDVAFTVDTIKYANTDSTYSKMFNSLIGGYNPADIRRIMDVVVLDERNINIVFDRSFSNNLEVLTFPIIPKHQFVNHADALKMDNYNPVGTGPYKFVEYEKFKNVKLEANSEYRDGKPYIQVINGKVFEDNNSILTAFETGQINMATTIGVDWDKYNQNSRIKAMEFISPNYEFLGFNFNKEIFQGEKGATLRKAMAYGIDRQAIIQKVYLGHGTQIDVPIHPDSWLLSEDAHIYGFNRDRAKEELRKAGWKDIDNDGILEDEDGNKLSLNLLTNTYNPLRMRTLELIADDLQKIGIEIVKDFPTNGEDNITEEMVSEQWEALQGKINQGDFDMVLLGWELSIIPELSFAFHSEQINNHTNFIGYSNENMDQLLVEAFNAKTRKEKIETYGKLQNHIVEELPYISLAFKNKALLMDNNIIGKLEPSFHNLYRGIATCYIQEKAEE